MSLEWVCHWRCLGWMAGQVVQNLVMSSHQCHLLLIDLGHCLDTTVCLALPMRDCAAHFNSRCGAGAVQGPKDAGGGRRSGDGDCAAAAGDGPQGDRPGAVCNRQICRGPGGGSYEKLDWHWCAIRETDLFCRLASRGSSICVCSCLVLKNLLLHRRHLSVFSMTQQPCWHQWLC